MIRVAVVGTGYWGINHVRAFARLPGAELVAVCDPSARALEHTAQFAPRAARRTRLDEVLQDPNVDAVVLATPAGTHADLARAAVAAGKHVLVEKPLALTAADAAAVVKAAAGSDRVVMVGHLMLFHPGYIRVRELVRAGEIGEVLYIYALRVNLGRVRNDENALWSLAPHDLSMILDLLGALPESVSARGQSYLRPGVEDVVFVNLAFADRKMAQIQLSWLDPRKERRLTIVGSRKMIEFDDVQPTEKLRVYDKGYDRPPTFTQYDEYLTIRHGDILIPKLDMTEPLDLELRHFLDCISAAKTPRTSAADGLAVVRVLEAAQQSLNAGGQPVNLRLDGPPI